MARQDASAPCRSLCAKSLRIEVGIRRQKRASSPPTPPPFPKPPPARAMVNQGTLWCLGITAATAVGIWIIHEQQTEERQVRPGAVELAQPGCCL